MSSKMSELDNWAITKIKTEYKDDIQLLIGHNSYRLPGDAELARISFFFPATDKAYDQTYINRICQYVELRDSKDESNNQRKAC